MSIEQNKYIQPIMFTEKQADILISVIGNDIGPVHDRHQAKELKDIIQLITDTIDSTMEYRGHTWKENRS